MSDPAVEVVRHAALWFEPEGEGVAAIVERCANSRVVLIGEATHGTQEFYRIRAEVTRALIERHGFNIVAVEADWPDAYRVNRWVRHESSDRTVKNALEDFMRFPRWMWRNTEVVRFLSWLREHNESRGGSERAGFYGLDLYSLHSSMAAVLEYLDKVDPAAAERARFRYRCFEGFGEDSQSYGYAATIGLTRSCEQDVVAQLIELRRRAAEYANRDGRIAADEYFMAEQNARLVKNAESYYRTMFGGRVESWNLRDTHMMETLDALLGHAARTSGSGTARAIVWAHNSHLGDARATEMGRFGELNLGQLARERYGADAKLIGFTTHTGSVTAAADWGEPAVRMLVQPSLPASYEALFHTTGLERFVLDMSDMAVREALTTQRLERAIGVIYRPETERASHYFTSQLPSQFDVVIHVDRTQALEPLDEWARVGGVPAAELAGPPTATAPAETADVAETYPTGF